MKKTSYKLQTKNLKKKKVWQKREGEKNSWEKMKKINSNRWLERLLNTLK